MKEDQDTRSLEERIERLEHMVRLLARESDLPVGSYAALCADLDWGSIEIQQMLDFFEEAEGGDKRAIWNLQEKLTQELGIERQAIKLVVLTLWANSQFREVCRNYAQENRCMEFDCKGMY